MKRFLMLVACAIVPLAMFAQAQITTKKMKLEDFPEKTTKIILSGNIFIDSTLEEAVKNTWTISPYEFCTLEEFEQLKGKSDYYFLMTVLGQFRKEQEPGITMLSLVKGGKGSNISLDKMLEVVTVPLCSAKYPSGRELVFMPALLNIIQTHVLASMERDYDAYGGLGHYSSNILKTKGMRIVISEDDIEENVSEKEIEMLKSREIAILPEEKNDELMEKGAMNTIVSYTVAPYEAEPGSYCYKMLIDTETHKLYYFRKHRISAREGAGFLKEDLLRIATL